MTWNTKDRVSNTLFQEALNDPTLAGYNLFSGGIDSNIDRMLVDVYRKNFTELTTADFKMSDPELFDLWAGPVGFLAGIEWRREEFEDDRDPRLDGTIQFTDATGDTFPIVSDVLGSSPTSDSSGDRDVFSAFVEFQVPLHDRLDAQFALRYEDFSDVGDTTVGKVALGWRPWDPFLVRGSWSEAYRVPNLVTVNETGVARSNTVDDRVCEYAESFDPDPANPTFDCSYGVQRAAGGSKELVAEESENTSIGVVWDITDDLTVTLDYWAIEKELTIGLFGEENHTALELLNLLEAGTGNCPTAGGPSSGNPAVIRDDPWDPASDEAAIYALAGICNTGEAVRVNDRYANLDTRKIRGHDIGVYYQKDTSAGDFNFRYVASKLDEYEQLASGPALELLEAEEEGILPPGSVVGFADLVRQNGNQRWKHTARVSWRMGDWGASVSGTKLTDAIETRPGVGSDGSQWVIKPMSTYNMSVDYRFDTFADSQARARFGVINFTDARAPLSSNRFGYFSDMHRDYGRAFYFDLRLDF